MWPSFEMRLLQQVPHISYAPVGELQLGPLSRCRLMIESIYAIANLGKDFG
jgi:hypothetical protein